MLTLADKASLLSRWNAMSHAKGAFIVMSVGCFATLALLFYASMVAPLPFSGYAPTWVASFVTMSSTALRFYLVRRGWSGVSARELANFTSHLGGPALSDAMARQTEQDCIDQQDVYYWSDVGSRPKSKSFVDEQVQAQLLRLASTQGFVSWKQVEQILVARFKSPALLEWIFIGRGAEPLAGAADWADACTSAARLDALAPQVSHSESVRRL